LDPTIGVQKQIGGRIPVLEGHAQSF
jgi:hypothetical protein